MKLITIHQNDTNQIQVFDDSDEPIEEYCNRLSELMKMGNVAILKTSSASVILRPSKVVGIKVEEGLTTTAQTPPNTPPEQTKAKQKEVEDIITDV